jgi:putative oxidoreductase
MFKKLLFGGTGGGSLATDIVLAVLRAFTGITLAINHGWAKIQEPSKMIGASEKLGFPMPFVFGWAANLTEFIFALFLAVGFLTRPSAFLIACTMLTAAFLQHARDPFARREPALMFLSIAIVFLVVGSGRFGIDALLFRPRRHGRGFEVVT